eukprot:CAMPEP_0113946622 /NCGR_PEP_ID=MMETSP1339-20121228/59025_1 /TAXON_ID=94617 /ORGANISM="Fibrocapsa japonica" /LENGTH=353 /DNA_ID=CAMNT_0000952811 /DNA_START=85 /DNA_END=1146 /DNA_ORIENTATION=+ /assembly_acc=CAM_ASM_000762
MDLDWLYPGSLTIGGVAKVTAYMVGGIISLAASLLYFFQNKLLYYPSMPGIPQDPRDNPKGYRNPWDQGMKYQDLFLPSSDGSATIHCWLILQPDRPRERHTVVFFHGNAGNIGFRLPNARMMWESMGVNLLMVDYRGYGKSTGVPTEEGLKEDGLLAVQSLERFKDEVDLSKVVVFGRSLGGAVALETAKALGPAKVRAVLLENSFLSISSMVDEIMPRFIRIFKSLVLRINWNNKETISKITQPIMFLSGARDELVPPEHMQELYKLANEAEFKEVHVVETGSHNDTWLRGGDRYYQAMKSFLEQLDDPDSAVDETLKPAPKVEAADHEEVDDDVIPTMPDIAYGKSKKKA